MYSRILHASDLSKNHYPLCEKAVALAKYHKADLYLLHVIEIPQTLLFAQNLGFMELIRPHQDDALLVLKTLGEALHVSPKRQFVEIGCVKQHILEKAQTLQCDLIVLGKHVHPLILGSNTYHVMQESSSDVLALS